MTMHNEQPGMGRCERKYALLANSPGSTPTAYRQPVTDDSASRYRRLAASIRDQIVDGRLQPGQLLPSSRAMASDYGVALDTVRQALAILRAEGLLVTRHGYGSVVRDEPSRTIVKIPPSSRVVARMPSQAERLELGIGEGVPVLVADGQVYSGDRVEIQFHDRSDATN